MAQTHITVELPVQAEGILPNLQMSLATPTEPGAVLPDGSTITLDPVTGVISASGGSGGTLVPQEQVAGAGTAWNLANAPLDDTEVQLFERIPGFGAVQLFQGVSLDYTIAGTAITTAVAYSAGTLFARYHK